MPQGARAKETWSYYPDGRWAERVIYAWTNSAWSAQTTQRFIWDGNLIVAILDVATGSIQTFLRGLDLSGTMQRAGGAGGLLATTDDSTGLSCFYAHDGNGSVVALVNFLDGTVAARYEYGPFAEPIRMTGPMALPNPMRFSGQFADDVSRTLKYPDGTYDPLLGRYSSAMSSADSTGKDLRSSLQYDPVNRVPSSRRFGANTPVLPAASTPTLTLSTYAVNAPRRGRCGDVQWSLWWLVSPGTLNPKGGWVVQKIKISWAITNQWGDPIASKSVDNDKVSTPLTYWEAWQVDRYGTFPIQVDGKSDNFNWGNEGCRTGGVVSWEGLAAFYHDQDLPNDFTAWNEKTLAGGLLASVTDPNLAASSKSVKHEMKISWDCLRSAGGVTKIESRTP